MNKIAKLKKILKNFESCVVAFSGGVDSSFLLKIARDTLPKKNILAVTAVSDTYTKAELGAAKKAARSLGARHKVIHTKELADPRFTKNPPDRCYYCKKELFSELKKIAKEGNFRFIADASNIDDKKDYRPGAIAKKELGIQSPLQEAGFTKKDIRLASKRLNLKAWDMPAMACLASRIPYGDKIEKHLLRRIEKAESFIRKSGINQARVRCHREIARIELDKKDIKKFLKRDFCDKIIKYLKQLGFKYVTLDLEGYRIGSLNEVLVSK